MPYPVLPPHSAPAIIDVVAAQTAQPLQESLTLISVDSARAIQLSNSAIAPNSAIAQLTEPATPLGNLLEESDSSDSDQTTPVFAPPPPIPLPQAAPSSNRTVWKDGAINSRPAAVVEVESAPENADLEGGNGLEGCPDVGNSSDLSGVDLSGNDLEGCADLERGADLGRTDVTLAESAVELPTESPDFPVESPAESSDLPQSAAPDTVPIRIRANQQDYEQLRQIVSAYGNVVLTLPNAVLDADRLWVNLRNRITVAEGDVALVRGDQIIRGRRVEYNLLQESGSVFDGSGVLFLPTIDSDLSAASSNDVLAQSTLPLSSRATAYQPVGQVTNPSNLEFGTEGDNQISAAALRRLRFESAQININAEGWEAEEIRVTNDPFSPPELEFRANSARITRISEFQDELIFERGRVVFDQGFSLPLPRSRFILNRGQVQADQLSLLPSTIGIDNRDRGGIFLGRSINVINSGTTRLRITPELYVGRFLDNAAIGSPENFGVVTSLSRQLGPNTNLRATASIPGLDLENIGDRLRASTRLQQNLGRHTLSLEALYRDRLFNGSLGFQNVQSSVGAVLTSPVYTLGDTGINLSYQLGGQYVTANTDLARFLEPGDTRSLISLGRFQGGVFLSRGFLLWQGEGLPATPDQGLRYTPTPVVPYVQLFTGLRGVGTYYTDSSFQQTLAGTVGIDMQFGHFSRPYLDYTRINLAYSEDLISGDQSPFLFDRNVDQQQISAGILQQIYGPFRAGIQTSYNLDTGDPINLDFILEYSRRTYGLVLRFNSTQNSGFVGFRLSNFDYTGNPGPLEGGSRRVVGGVVQ